MVRTQPPPSASGEAPPFPTFSALGHVAGAAVADGRYPPGHRYAPHCDGRPRISVVLQGAVMEEARGEEAFASAASVVVKPADVRHANAFGPDGARLVSAILPEALWTDALDRWRWHHAGPVGGAALRFARALRQSPAEAEDDLWALLAAVTDDGTAGPVPPWLRRARERMDDEPVAGPSVAALAADADVHPVSLARAFRRAYGCAPTTYRRRLRVRRAADLLASSDAPAAHVALDAGFADQSHMCRDVRAELGLTPGQLRALPA